MSRQGCSSGKVEKDAREYSTFCFTKSVPANLSRMGQTPDVALPRILLAVYCEIEYVGIQVKLMEV
jgi:hypothetical protein